MNNKKNIRLIRSNNKKITKNIKNYKKTKYHKNIYKIYNNIKSFIY